MALTVVVFRSKQGGPINCCRVTMEYIHSAVLEMSNNNFAAVLYAPGDLRVEEFPMPTLKEDDLLIRPHTTGICGSDMHYLHEGRIGSLHLKDPVILGHEASGTVAAVGSKVTGFAVGDRIAIEPPVPCWKCEFCKIGRCNLCPNVLSISTPPVHGTLRRFMEHPARCCWKIPDSMTFEEGAMLEPLAIAVQGCQRACVRFGQNILILGAGPIGVTSLLVSKAAGALRVMVTDINEKRLEMIKELGADFTLNVSSLTPDEVARRVFDLMGAYPDVVLDCVAVENSVQNAVKCVKRGGKIGVLGLGGDEMKVPMFDIISKEIDLLGSYRFAYGFHTAMDLVTSGKVDLKKIAVAHYPLEQSAEAFKRAQQGDVVKVFIHCESGDKGCKVF